MYDDLHFAGTPGTTITVATPLVVFMLSFFDRTPFGCRDRRDPNTPRMRIWQSSDVALGVLICVTALILSVFLFD